MLERHSLWRLLKLQAVFGFSVSCVVLPANAAVTSSGLGTSVSGATDFVITGGTTQGGNLFHSFGQFNLDSGLSETATFDNGAAAAITNVIGRITGGASNIDGPISFTGSSLSSANLYLVNPAGIVFGSGAQLNVPGSFHASTSDNISLNGTIFDASTTAGTITGSALYAQSPTAFGFLNDASFNGITLDGADLEVDTNQSLSIVGAGVTLNSGSSLSADSGQVNIVSVSSAGSVNIDAPTTGSFASGNVDITGSNIEVSGLSGDEMDPDGASGDIYIRGGNLTLTSANIFGIQYSNSDTNGDMIADGDGGDITLSGTGDVSISGGVIYTGSNLFSPTGDGDTGDVSVTGSSISTSNNLVIYSLAGDGGDAGDVTIVANDGVSEGFDIFDATLPEGMPTPFTPGDADISLVDTTIYSLSSSTGSSGSVFINGGQLPGFLGFLLGPSNADTLYLSGTDIYSLSTGNNSEVSDTNVTGSVIVNATNALIDDSQLHSDTDGAGNAGIVALNGSTWQVQNGSIISSISSSTGDAGNININVDDFTLNASMITSSVSGVGATGNAGNINVRTCNFLCQVFGGGSATATSSFVVENDAVVTSSTATVDLTAMQIADGDKGNAGTVNIFTDSLVVTGTDSEINTTTQDGAGGNISINIPTSGTANINSGGQIVSNTVGDGDAGSITFTGDGDITLSGGGGEYQLESSQLQGDQLGDAGDISVTGNSISFVSGGRITSSTSSTATGFEMDGMTPRTSDAGSITLTASLVDTDSIGLSKILTDAVSGNGNAGSITINADTLNLGLADVFSNNSSGQGGVIDFNVTGVTTIDNVTFIRASSSGSGTAGQIDINTGSLVLDDDSYIRSSNVGGGDAGGVLINASSSVAITNGSDIQSSANGSGMAGAIDITANTFTLDNSQIQTNNVNGLGGVIGITATTQGDITNNVPSLGDNEQTQISSSSSGSGRAGKVSLSGGTWNITGDTMPGDMDGSEGLGSTTIQSTASSTGGAGDIEITGNNALNIGGFALITSSSTGSGNAGNVQLTSASGSVDISGSAAVTSNSSSGTGAAGGIAIMADTFTLDGATISSETSAGIDTVSPMDPQVGTIEITANTGTIENTDSSMDTVISANTSGAGTAGNIRLLGGTWGISGNAMDDPMAMTNLDLSTRITSNTTSSGDAGNVEIIASGPVTISDYALLATASNGGTTTGDAGNIRINASNTITLESNAQITSSLNTGSNGNAGNVVISTEVDGMSETMTGDTVTIQTGAVVSSSSENGNNNIVALGGNAGSITIDTDIFSIIDNSEINTTNNAGTIVGGMNTNGRISITANETGTINTTSASGDAAEIKSNTVGNGDAGRIGIFGGDWTINGTTGFSYPDYQAQIATNQTDMSGMFTGDAGDILVMVDTLTMQNRGKIESSTSGTATGGMGQVSDAGNIMIVADDLVMPGPGVAQIYSNATGMGVNGSAGDIDITVTNLDLNLGDIFAQNNDGAGGNVTITADTASISASTFVKTDTSGSGTAGNIQFLGGDWTFDGTGNQITSEALSGATGNAGNIGATVDTLTITGGDIATSTAAGTPGNAGNIVLQANTSINISGSTTDITSSTGSGSTGNAGTVTLSTEADMGDATGDTISISGGASIASNSSSGSGAAGNITITTDDFDIDGASITSVTNTGINDDLAMPAEQRGSITITAQNQGTIVSTTGTKTIISANTIGSGSAGNISLDGANWTISGNAVDDAAVVAAAEMAMMDPDIADFSTQVTSSTTGVDGDAGQIAISTTGTVNINNYAQVATNTSTNGLAGAVGVFATGGATLDSFAQLASNTTGTGNAGKVVIQNASTLTIQGGAEVSSGSSSAMMGAGAAGNIEIDTGLFIIDDAEITTETSAGTGGNIEIDFATGFIRNDADITADSDGSNNAGMVDIAATTALDITSGATVSSNSVDGTGEAGSVTVAAPVLTLDGGNVTTTTNAGSMGLGAILINAPVFTASNGATVQADTQGTGNAGSINVIADTSLTINSASQVSSSSAAGSGDAGSVSLTTPDLLIDGATVTTINRDGTAGDASITIDATAGVGSVDIINSARVNADTLGTGDAGDIVINAQDVDINTGSQVSSSSEFAPAVGGGSAGTVSITAGDITVDNATVQTVNNSGGTLATIDLFATNSSTGILTNGAQVIADTVGTGGAGNIILRGPNWIIDGATTQVSSSTSGDGAAGQIDVTTGNFLLDAATILTDTSAAGASGDITVTTTSGNIQLVNGGTIQSNVNGGTGNGGIVTLDSAANVLLNTGSEVSTSTFPNMMVGVLEGNAGDIFINAVNSLEMRGMSVLTSRTTSDGEAGTITINTGDTIYLLNSTVLADSSGATSPGVAGGNLDVTTGILVLDSSTLDVSAGLGTGGNVSITADFFFISPDSVIDVSSAGGASGTLSVNAVAVDLSGSLSGLKIKFQDGGKLLRQACGVQKSTGNSSSFIVDNGIDGIPAVPNDLQSGSILDLKPAGSAVKTSNTSKTVEEGSVTGIAASALFATIGCGGLQHEAISFNGL